jgi:hypothetical protein
MTKTTIRGTVRKLAPYVHWTQRPENAAKVKRAAKKRTAALRKTR